MVFAKKAAFFSLVIINSLGAMSLNQAIGESIAHIQRLEAVPFAQWPRPEDLFPEVAPLEFGWGSNEWRDHEGNAICLPSNALVITQLSILLNAEEEEDSFGVEQCGFGWCKAVNGLRAIVFQALHRRTIVDHVSLLCFCELFKQVVVKLEGCASLNDLNPSWKYPVTSQEKKAKLLHDVTFFNKCLVCKLEQASPA